MDIIKAVGNRNFYCKIKMSCPHAPKASEGRDSEKFLG